MGGMGLRKITYFGQEYTPHEYIKLNVVTNRGSHNNIDRAVMVEYCKGDNIPITGKESKAELFDIMCENGYTDERWEEIAKVGVISTDYQKEFGISHTDVKRLEKFQAIKTIAFISSRAYGKHMHTPLYSLSQFLSFNQNDIDALLLEYPKGKRINSTTVREEVKNK